MNRLINIKFAPKSFSFFLLIFYLLLFCPFPIIAQEFFNSEDSSYYNNNHVRLVFYNTENFFDTYKDSLRKDSEFTPGAIRHWTPKRYYKKLNNISKVLIAAGEWEAPGIIGLCEIENKIVLHELIHKTPLKKFDYNIIHFDSPDARGLGVALLYRPEIFKPLYEHPIRIHLPSNPGFKTRDILYVKGILLNKDTLHLFVNHWPSRLSGQIESQKRRTFVASVLKYRVDSLIAINQNSNIIIMGDFNDNPADSSISNVLKAECILPPDTSELSSVEQEHINEQLSTNNDQRSCGLINLMCLNKSAGEWTFLYNINAKLFTPQKDVIDQFIVSCNLINNPEGLAIRNNKAYIFNKDWLIQKDKYGNEKPFSTYNGYKYIGGFSDHLPVYMDLIYR